MFDFEIENNLIIFKNKIVAIFILEPVDIFLMSKEQYLYFETNIKKFLNAIRQEKIQIIMRSRNTNIKDYNKHFKSLKINNKANKVQNEFISNYISQMSELIEKNTIPFKEYFIIFSIKGNTKILAKRIENTKKLETFINNVTSPLLQTNIKLKHLTNYNNALEKLLRSFLRPII